MTAATRRAGPLRAAPPTLRQERALLREGHAMLVGMDEVGRGALAGPVSVGVVAVRLSTRTAPSGVRDSKLLTPAARRALVPRLRRWASDHAVGHAGPEEIDRYGIIAALRLAGHRALAALTEQPGIVLLDGSHDWLSPPEQGVLLDPAPLPDLARRPVVTTRIKADLRCAAVAAASVLAKVERDDLMVTLSREHPDYGWRENKGYASPEHSAALRRLGACPLHRRSWNLALDRVDELAWSTSP